ncbi:hypothetical protein K523DRAFT_114197 [Schizophyllum commune Tattone D]|nr:hypothetical protein K523DRAFT_114197 [Schizophyllum commune Tattone D]
MVTDWSYFPFWHKGIEQIYIRSPMSAPQYPSRPFLLLSLAPIFLLSLSDYHHVRD